jgi:uncharacterized protein (TIGR00661 family)
MRYIDYESPPGLELESQVTKTIIRAMVPRPDVSLVTTFFFGALRNQRTFLFPPILRREVLARQPRDGEHILVYVTGDFASLIAQLRGFRRERFHVYGYDRDEQDGVLVYKPFSKEGFLDDLAGAKAVVATAGFTLMSEALYLRKPYLALPMQGQFEQQLNAYQLNQLGYGKNADAVDSAAVGDFLYRLPDYEARLLDYQAGDNGDIKTKLDELLAEECALVREFHAARADS